MVRRSLLLAGALAASHSTGSNASCASRGTYKVAHSTEDMEGGEMFCVYPSVADAGQLTGTGFPLLSFEHGDGGGGDLLVTGYASLLEALASSGFVVCAPKLCPISCRNEQATHQLNALVAAQALGTQGKLPIRSGGLVGVVGHSTGGMTTLKCAAEDAVAAHGIGAAMVYNGDGGTELLPSDNVSFDSIDETLPMFMVTGSADVIEPKGSTQSNHDLILTAKPGQRLLTAMIDKEGHLDPNDVPLVHKAKLRAVPYIIAFFGYTLEPSQNCSATYENVLGPQLQSMSSGYYDNRLFSAEPVHI